MKRILNEHSDIYLHDEERDTSWVNGNNKITLKDMLYYFDEKFSLINIQHILAQIPPLLEYSQESIDIVDLQHPIIIVKNNDGFKYILDGNHRLQKAINEEFKFIKARILDLSDKSTPEKFKIMFGDVK
jgi:hypothetical protein